METRAERIRKTFVMQLKPGMKAVYKKDHDEIWPEVGGLDHEY